MKIKPLRFVFPRLFHLCDNKEVSVDESGLWVDGNWEWVFNWRRELLKREKGSVEALTGFLSHHIPCAGKTDGWTWKASKEGVYTTKSAYSVMAATKNVVPAAQDVNETLAAVWETPAPFKVRVTAWRCLRNRLATCDNLIKRNVAISTEESACNGCVSGVETVDHLFLLCPKVEQVWDGIQKWLGFSTVRPHNITHHFTSFTHLGRRKRSEKFLKTVWTCTIWLLWKRRNESRFDGKGWEVQMLIQEIKGRLWS
ncbi:uncharacterized protein LOC131018894 [Salvia miltiorrhiza]|uniref:uncharacterized protein LOC131018894 n=1 Tax=Salvia miltiorrhiza TaxID=226208 RepID=UPI0025AC4189|nr:uncharacterized protein LOC131018894 [Salvia miltiorrhiza]